MKFTLTIELGNEAMTSGYDLADRLRHVASKLDHYSDFDLNILKQFGNKIYDANGGDVGTWEIT